MHITTEEPTVTIQDQRKQLIYNRIIKERGNINQILKACEEMGELMQALSKYQIYRTLGRKSDVHREIVDVYIMLEQLCIMFNLPKNKFKMIQDDKLRKLESIVERYEKKDKRGLS